MAPTVSLSSSASTVAPNTPVTLTWSSTNATGCTASGAWSGNKSTSGSEVVAPLINSATFTLACDGPGGSTSRSVTVAVDNSDTIAPTVSMTAPANGATVSGSTIVSASASDNVSVVGVQFRLDGTNLGPEDTTSPYSLSWSTPAATNGGHSLTAIARDAAGNSSTSTTVTVTVSNAGGAPLVIDGNQRFQMIDGFGVSANAASWDNGELRPAIDMLVDQNGSTIWRVVMEMADWEATNDDNDPNTFNWVYYNSIYASPRFDELWNLMQYLNQKGITSTLMLNFMGRGPPWMGGADLPIGMEDEWVETVASVAYYALNTRHVQFGLFAPNNEPDWDGIEGIRMDQFQYPRVMRKLAQKLDAIGLANIRLVGPDTADVSSGVNAFMPEMMAETAIMAKLDHFALHNYAGNSGGAAAAIASSALPTKNFWISEVSNIWDALAHISQGPAAIIVWDGYDSVYNHAILAGRGTVPPNDAGNGPALLSYDTSTHAYAPRKAFYEFAQLFRFVPAGSVRVAAIESNGNVTIYAFHHAATGRLTLVGRNEGASNVTFSATLSNLPTIPSFEFYETNASENLRRGGDVPVTGNAFAFVAPRNSIFTLTYPGVP